MFPHFPPPHGFLLRPVNLPFSDHQDPDQDQDKKDQRSACRYGGSRRQSLGEVGKLDGVDAGRKVDGQKGIEDLAGLRAFPVHGHGPSLIVRNGSKERSPFACLDRAGKPGIGPAVQAKRLLAQLVINVDHRPFGETVSDGVQLLSGGRR